MLGSPHTRARRRRRPAPNRARLEFGFGVGCVYISLSFFLPQKLSFWDECRLPLGVQTLSFWNLNEWVSSP